VSLVAAYQSVPKRGETANGDAAVVRLDESGRILLAVIDGLGHGPIAAQATAAALVRLAPISLDISVFDLMNELHVALRDTRGAVATACIVRQRRVEACAVGNVMLSCFNASIPLVLSPGVLGHRVPKIRTCSGELKQNARIALSSDGISSKFRLDEFERMKPSIACEAVITRYGKQEDDATILIADMDG
jgi:negative regulator of sigma-B (phosphoserine phosphatase)